MCVRHQLDSRPPPTSAPTTRQGCVEHLRERLEDCRGLRVNIPGDRPRTEQRDDAVARVLVHGAFEAVHSFSEDLQEASE